MRNIDQLTDQELDILREGINLLVEVSHANAIDKGFASANGPKRSPAELVALLHSECSELLEAFREGIFTSEKIGQFTNEEEELADLLIRSGDTAGERGTRLAEAFLAKSRFNRTRPHRHGKGF